MFDEENNNNNIGDIDDNDVDMDDGDDDDKQTNSAIFQSQCSEVSENGAHPLPPSAVLTDGVATILVDVRW